MPRTVWSSDRFDRQLAIVFEQFASEEKKIRKRFARVIKELLEGSPEKMEKHNESGSRSRIPFVGDYVIVFAPRSRRREISGYVDISEADHIDLLGIERRPK